MTEMQQDQGTAGEAEAAAVESLSYEQARAELIETVKQLEGGQVPLDQTLALWERGEALATHCQAFLDAASARIEAAGRGE